MTGIRNQITGLIRFSFATSCDFYPGFASVDALQAFLFDPDRLERRFAWFEQLCLPSLRAQSDPDFTCILLVGAAMPKPFKDRLRDVTKPLAAARIVEMPPAVHYAAIKAAFATVPSDGFTHRTTFRLDDDDAVDFDYIARLKRLVPEVLRLNGPDRPAAIAFNRGFYIFRKPNNTVIEPTCDRMPISVGAAVVAPLPTVDNVYLHNHRQLPQHYTTWLDCEAWSYIRTIHRDNKAAPKRSGMALDMSNKEAGLALFQNFGLSLQDLKRLDIP